MIAKEFKTKREAMGLTQAELAKRLCVGTSMIAQIEVGMKMPSVALLKMAADLFGCTTDELLGRDPPGKAGRESA